MNLQELRDQVDQLDAQLIEILAQRFACTRQIGNYKKQFDKPAVDNGREDYVVNTWCELAREHNIEPELAAQLIRAIMSQVVREHKAIRDVG